MERTRNKSKYLDDRSLYFEQVDPQQWSLINFLTWRPQRYTGALDREKEHGAFKCLLQKVANGKSTDRAKKAQAQELLNGWQTIKNSSEVKAFWKEQKFSKLQDDIMITRLQNEKKSMEIQSEDLEYVYDRKKELNEHANVIGRKRCELIEQSISDGSSSNDAEEKASKRKTVIHDDDNDIKLGSPSKKMMTDYSSPVMSPSSTKSSDSTYVPSSLNSINSIISEEFTQRRKQYYIQYFVGPGIVDWNPDNPKWVINDVDVSDMCCNYRASVTEKCESKMMLNATEELALSHIFVFEEGNPQGLREYFDDELWEDIFNEFRGIYPNSSIPEGVYDIFMNVNKIVFEKPNYKDRQDAVRNYLQNRNQEEIMVEIIRNLAENEQSSFTKNYKIEDTHVHYNIAPILNPFFKKNRKTVIDWANTTSESSAMANKSFDQTLSGVKPDLIVRTTNPKKHVELLIGEIKPHNTKDKMVAMDLVNLGKTMKNALDKSIKDGVDDLVICGLQVIGFLGRVYILDLQYEGIYRMILVGECQFPEGVTSWGTVLGCYQALATIQNIINEGAAKYQLAIRNKKQINTEKVRMSKPTFHSPMKIPYSPNH